MKSTWRKVLTWETTEQATIPPYDPEEPMSLWRAIPSWETRKQAAKMLAAEIEMNEEGTSDKYLIDYSGYAVLTTTVDARNAAEAYFLAKVGYEYNNQIDVGEDWELNRVIGPDGTEYDA